MACDNPSLFHCRGRVLMTPALSPKDPDMTGKTHLVDHITGHRRMRRNRKADWTRRLVRETQLSVDDLIWPIFLVAGSGIVEPIRAHRPLDRDGQVAPEPRPPVLVRQKQSQHAATTRGRIRMRALRCRTSPGSPQSGRRSSGCSRQWRR